MSDRQGVYLDKLRYRQPKRALVKTENELVRAPTYAATDTAAPITNVLPVNQALRNVLLTWRRPIPVFIFLGWFSAIVIPVFLEYFMLQKLQAWALPSALTSIVTASPLYNESFSTALLFTMLLRALPSALSLTLVLIVLQNHKLSLANILGLNFCITHIFIFLGAVGLFFGMISGDADAIIAVADFIGLPDALRAIEPQILLKNLYFYIFSINLFLPLIPVIVLRLVGLQLIR